MKKNILQIVTLFLCAVLLVITIAQGMRLDEYQQQLEIKIESLNESVKDEIQRISYSIEQELEEANQAVSAYALEPIGIDIENRALLADLSVTLKEWHDDTTITLLATVGTEQISLPMTVGENGTFEARASLPLEESCEVILNALISGGGLTKQEMLGGWSDISMLLPLQNTGSGWSGPEYQDGVLSSDFQFHIEAQNGYTGAVRNPEFQIYKNGELTQTLAAGIDPYSPSDLGHYYTVNTWSIECDIGDSIELRFRCEDEYGLGYNFPFQIWVAEGETSDHQVITGEAFGSSMLTLYWPE